MRTDKITVEHTTPSLDEKGGQFFGRGVAHTETPDATALFCWLQKEALIAALEKEVDSVSDDSKSLSGEERQAREESLLSSILDGERAEEWFCEQAEADGGSIERRTDLDPRAYLGVTGPALADW